MTAVADPTSGGPAAARWPARGRRPRSCGRARSEWLCGYGFARPGTGRGFTAILPRVDAERMGEALAAFARRHVAKEL